MEGSGGVCRFVEEEHLSREGRLWGEWSLGSGLKDAQGLSRQRDRRKELDKEGCLSIRWSVFP